MKTVRINKCERKNTEFPTSKYIVSCIILILIIPLSSCSSLRALFGTDTVENPETYPEDQDFYPALYEWLYSEDGIVEQSTSFATSRNLREPFLASADVFNNVYQVNNIVAVDGVVPVLINIQITLDSDNTVQTEIFEAFSFEDGRWRQITTFLFFDEFLFKQDISADLISIGNDEEIFEVADANAIANSNFMYVVMKDMTTLARETFFENNIFGERATFVGDIVDIEEVNETVNETEYKYRMYLANEIEVSLPNYNYENITFAYFYTNDDSVVNIQQRTQTFIEGTYTAVNQGLRDSLFLRIVE